MRTIQCSHCNATNRRPKCGSCQKEISDPPAIQLAWMLYDRRKYIEIALLVSLFAIVAWRPWEPTNNSECRVQAARTARSNDAMHVVPVANQIRPYW
jgi:hypothetical protein